MMRSRFLAMLASAALLAALIPATASAVSTTLYVDDDNLCGGYSPCYLHPQDAVNAANPGDTILVYPGTYGERRFTTPVPPHWNVGDQYAPALIVWKDDLTIQAVDPTPDATVIQTLYDFWVNKDLGGGGGGGSIEHSTGCTWNAAAKTWDGTCVRPKFGTAPNAVAVIASGVTLDGFTFHRPVAAPNGGYNAAGVMIGGLYAGYGGAGETLGFSNNTVKNSTFSNVWQAVYIWHSRGNQILDNTVAALGNTGHWAAISSYDGYNDAQIALGNLSEDNLIANNTLADKGISVGAWAPATWTSNAGDKILCNTTTQVGVTYAHGPVLVACNTGEFWGTQTDKVLRVTDIFYAGDTGVFPLGTPVTLTAQLAYDGNADGSGVKVTFTLDGTTYSATTAAGGLASVSVTPPVGVYQAGASVTFCECCTFTSDTQPLVIYDPAGGFVTGGGWIMSPAGAYKADLTLEGKATFGFVSKYKKGASVPDGNTEFQFKAGDLNFHSTSYQWLVVNKAGMNAQFKGTGTINGAGTYGFMIWATDNTPDTFRIKIWDAATEVVVYDNGVEQALGGGSIVVHIK